MMNLTLHIFTTQGIIFSDEVTAVSFPSIEGMFQILKNHAPFISVLKKGRIKIQSVKNIQNDAFSKEGEDYFFPINGGTVEVNQNQINLLAE